MYAEGQLEVRIERNDMKLHKLILPVIAIATGVTLASQLLPATAQQAAKAFNFTGFTSISASSSADVVLKQGPFSISAVSSDGKFDDLLLEMRGDKLVVGRQNSSHWFGMGNRRHYTVTVTAPSIAALTASSSADIVAAAYTFKDLAISVNSSGNIKVAGTCGHLEVDVSSSGDFVGKDLRCETASVDASSSGDADVYAAKSARGSASSSGDIRFYGNPPQIEKHTSSSGSVKSL